jgi:integrase
MSTHRVNRPRHLLDVLRRRAIPDKQVPPLVGEDAKPQLGLPVDLNAKPQRRELVPLNAKPQPDYTYDQEVRFAKPQQGEPSSPLCQTATKPQRRSMAQLGLTQPTKPERVPRSYTPLTERRISMLKAAGKPSMIADGGSRGLYIRTTNTAHQQFIHRYMFQGRKRYVGLGSADLLSLAEARAIVIDHRRMMLAGTDPLLARRSKQHEQAKADTTFADVLENFLAIHGRKWARGIRIEFEWRNSLAKYMPRLMATSIGLVDTDAIIRELRPLWVTNPKLGERLRSRVEQVWSLAKTAGLVQGDNCAVRKGHLQHLLPHVITERTHHKALGHDRIGALLLKLRQSPSDVTNCLAYLIHVAARSGEARGLRLDELDFVAKTIRIPGTRTKTKTEHVIPMSTQVHDLLQAQVATRQPNDVLVFVGRKRRLINETSLMQILKRLGYEDEATVHGFRSTFRTS